MFPFPLELTVKFNLFPKPSTSYHNIGFLSTTKAPVLITTINAFDWLLNTSGVSNPSGSGFLRWSSYQPTTHANGTRGFYFFHLAAIRRPALVFSFVLLFFLSFCPITVFVSPESDERVFQ